MMRKMVMGAFFPLCFLLLVVHWSEAGVVIDESKNVSNEDTNMLSNEKPNISSTTLAPLESGNVTKDAEEMTTVTPAPQTKKPCLFSHQAHSVEHLRSGESNHGNDSPVKEDDKLSHETAFQQISDKVSGVLSTIKTSIASIFSPGIGLGRVGEMGCANNTNTIQQEEEDGDDHSKLVGEEGKLLIHPVSSNDTNNNTNVTTSTTLATTTLEPDAEEHL